MHQPGTIEKNGRGADSAKWDGDHGTSEIWDLPPFSGPGGSRWPTPTNPCTVSGIHGGLSVVPISRVPGWRAVESSVADVQNRGPVAAPRVARLDWARGSRTWESLKVSREILSRSSWLLFVPAVLDLRSTRWCNRYSRVCARVDRSTRPTLALSCTPVLPTRGSKVNFFTDDCPPHFSSSIGSRRGG